MHELGKFVHEPSGISLLVNSDLDQIASQLKKLAPVDAGKISTIFNGARNMRGRDLSTFGMSQPPELASIFSRAREMWQMFPVARYFTGRYTQKISEFANEVQTPWLKDFFSHIFLPESPVWFVMMCLAIVADKQSGFLSKGCLAFVLEIEKHFKEIGGSIHYKSTVDKILVKNDKATGVRLDDGQEFKADYVISCGDGYHTIYNLLNGRYVSDFISNRFETWPLCRPYLTASFGVKREFADVRVQ
jgi:phytoene dehydrogenase-like protein